MEGLIQVYTGNGKGKTTAALGLVVRAAGSGLRSFVGQFLKTKKTSEYIALSRFQDLITIEPFGRGRFVRQITPEDKELAQRGWERCLQVLGTNDYDIIVMDELNVALHLGLLPIREILKGLEKRSTKVEIIITGRWAPKELIEMADLVTEMREIKHYYRQGIKARRGIEY